jgi:hypothetical protein
VSFFYAIWQKGEIFVPKLNDIQIAELIVKHTNGASISALAKEYRINWETAKRYIENNKEIQEKSKNIKKETLDRVLADTFNNLSTESREILVLSFCELKKKIPQASVRDLVGLISTFSNMRSANQDNSSKENLDRLCEAITQVIKDE